MFPFVGSQGPLVNFVENFSDCASHSPRVAPLALWCSAPARFTFASSRFKAFEDTPRTALGSRLSVAPAPPSFGALQANQPDAERYFRSAFFFPLHSVRTEPSKDSRIVLDSRPAAYFGAPGISPFANGLPINLLNFSKKLGQLVYDQSTTAWRCGRHP